MSEPSERTVTDAPKIITSRFGYDDAHTLLRYEGTNGYDGLKAALAKRPDITHVFLVTDSEAAYAQMCSRLPATLRTSMLYRDYLGNFRINTPEAYR